MNKRINKKSYHIAGLPQTLGRIVQDDIGGLKDAEAETGMDERSLRRAYTTGNVSRTFWKTLLHKLPRFRDELEALCPEGWGGAGSNAQSQRLHVVVPSRTAQALGFFAEGLRLPGRKTDYTIAGRIEGYSRTASFKAHDADGRPVFIKTLLDFPKAATQKAKADIDRLEVRFGREASSHTKLRDIPRIAHVLDHNRIQPEEFPYPIPFLVQEF